MSCAALRFKSALPLYLKMAARACRGVRAAMREIRRLARRNRMASRAGTRQIARGAAARSFTIPDQLLLRFQSKSFPWRISHRSMSTIDRRRSAHPGACEQAAQAENDPLPRRRRAHSSPPGRKTSHAPHRFAILHAAAAKKSKRWCGAQGLEQYKRGIDRDQLEGWGVLLLGTHATTIPEIAPLAESMQ